MCFLLFFFLFLSLFCTSSLVSTTATTSKAKAKEKAKAQNATISREKRFSLSLRHFWQDMPLSLCILFFYSGNLGFRIAGVQKADHGYDVPLQVYRR
uniref:Secreted protein n=1 Tax=Caenorhabditis japonica TaxID=281687 RepID=A0A8R1IN11_CAEJA